jgi:tetrapyrrole methylase family protein/MazG family protein
MNEFTRLIEILDRLLGPGGCPWDQEQTMESLRCTLLEETCELIEAIDLQDDPNIKEELGDLFLNAVFLCKLAEKEERFPMREVLHDLNEKLVRRHPHVFGDGKAESVDEVLDQWNAIKREEIKHLSSVLDTLPKGLPSLARAKKAIKRMKKADFEVPEREVPDFETEEELGELLLAIAAKAGDMDPEIALRKRLTHLEHEFRSFEKA